MNLYTIDTIKQELTFKPLTYTIKSSDFSEALILNYTDAEGNEHQEKVNAAGSLLSNWLEVLDYDVESKETLDSTFTTLQSTVDLFISYKDMNTAIAINELKTFIACIDNTAFVDIASNILSIIKRCLEPHPALMYLYPSYYNLLSCLYLYSEHKISVDDAAQTYFNILNNLCDEMDLLKDSYDEARKYADSVCISPYTKGASVPTASIASMYHTYQDITKKSDFYSEFFDYPVFTGELPSWNSYMNTLIETIPEAGIQTIPITSLSQFLHIGFTVILSGGMVIRKCKLCNGYFLSKYTSDQLFCSRIYKKTAGTCAEAGVRKTYKEKLNQHPIHQEFTKSYNKLYGRIRRGKEPADTPVMDELKRLHDEYTEKYEHTHKKDREAVWKEYIQKNKDLLDNKK